MRIIIIAAWLLAATASTAWAEAVPAEPAKTETPAASATPDNSAGAAKAAVQEKAAKPRESGLNQPLCTGE
ncbi:MAG TPA: hypothetical protein VFR06_10490 [Gallionellaceae bacterium]|nr:hypothetical protein [Gallionellaceae bacterium]